MSHKIKVGITHGDINGIGYETILKALEDPAVTELFTPVVYGSAKIAAGYRKQLEMQEPHLQQVASAAEAQEGQCSIINVVGEDVRPEPGVASKDAGQAAFAALEAAVADLRAGTIDAMVTAPIDKASIQSEEFRFPGHTEYLESATAENGERALMILCNDYMRVALVTTHLPLSQVPAAITKEEILSKLTVFNQSLRRDFGIGQPRIAVLALNPHAGDTGLLGTEETEIIAPAIAEARERKIMAFGPYAADGFFGAGRFVKFDGILAMYHDQGLAPFKALVMDQGYNFTAGLPVVRTSPDHGTGYDIAGRGEASPESMRAAIYAAIDIVRNRRAYDEAHRSPLRKQYRDKEADKDNVKLDLT